MLNIEEGVKKIRHSWRRNRTGGRKCQKCGLVLSIAHIKVPPCLRWEPKPEALLTDQDIIPVPDTEKEKGGKYG